MVVMVFMCRLGENQDDNSRDSNSMEQRNILQGMT